MNELACARSPNGELMAKLKNITYAKQYITMTLKKLNEGDKVEDETVLALLQYHPSKKININNIEYLQLKKRPPFNTLALYYKYKSNDFVDDVSYVLCIKNLFGKYTPDKHYVEDVVSAFRNESHFGSKKKYFVEHTVICDDVFVGVCDNCHVSTTSITTDHSMVPFKVILNTFVEKEDILLNTVEIFENDKNELRIKDTDLAQKWREFHDTHATYRLLCKSCNSHFGSYGY